MNHSIHSADRSTHLKIVVVALVAGIAVAAFGISARTNSEFTQTAQTQVMKAGKPVVITSSQTSTVDECQRFVVSATQDGAGQSGKNVDVHITDPSSVGFCDTRRFPAACASIILLPGATTSGLTRLS